MNVLKFVARSPIAWLMVALGALFVAPLAASADEIIQLTPQNPSVNGQIVGNSGVASQIYQIDYVAGQYVDVRLTPTNRSQWWVLTAAQGKKVGTTRSRNNGFWAEVWTPTGRIDRADFRKAMSSSCSAKQASADGSCIGFSASGASVIHTLAGPFMVKVNAVSPVSIPYTVEARRLGAPRETNMGAAPGGMGPMLNNRNAQTGTLTGSKSGSSAYYTFMHPGGGIQANGGAQTEFLAIVTPKLATADLDKLGINVYRGATKVAGNGTNRAGESASSTDPGIDSTRIGGGPAGHMSYDTKYNSYNPELLTVEFFNYAAGTTVNYAIHVK